MNINSKQLIAIVIAVLSVLSGSTAQLTDLFGSGVAKYIISFSSLATTTLSSVLAVISSQSSTVKEVLSMPGVERVNVNENANKTLASIAMDTTLPNISPTPQAMNAVSETAKGT